jgi:2,3-bisphosphoglycerate-independent phosphoglycerate mutase
MQVVKRALLIILDGFGIRENSDYNAISQANMPNWKNLTSKYAFGALDASSESVGLPGGQFGNSEVGHLNIGAGRVVMQDITRIDSAIRDKSFFDSPIFLNALDNSKSKTVHIMGLLSDGGVHAHIDHILALIKLANSNNNINKIWLHLFLDGRDTPPQSAIKYLEEINKNLGNNPKAEIATISGRYYAMDRDKRYDRIECAYNAIIRGQSDNHATNVLDIVRQSYQNNINDEFVRPCVLNDYTGVEDGDSIIFANFRSDRAIQLTDAIINPEFSHFMHKQLKLSAFVTMTSYDPTFNLQVAFSPNIVNNTLGEYLSSLDLKQLRIAETEKYPHVTYFFNGGVKRPSSGEDWILVDSPRDVATYDEKPEMSLPAVTDRLLEAIKNEKYDVIITNFANGDMVGHSGNLEATIKAVEAIDVALGKLVPEMLKHNGEILIIADHGNCEEMYDYISKQPHTQHTTNLVPCLYIGRSAIIKGGGALKDVAPSILSMCGIEQPVEMTGHSLIEFRNYL